MTGARRSGIRNINVPGPLREGLDAIAELDEDESNALWHAVASAETFQRVADLEELAQHSLPKRHQDKAEGLVGALLSLSTLSRTHTASSVVDAVSKSSSLEIDDKRRDRLRVELQRLIETPAIYSAAAAIDLLTQHERNYSSARVVTDVRPVFSSDVEEQPTGAVIVETLHLQTWDRDGNSETLHVAMDDVDLRELRDVIERALVKAETLREMLSGQGIAYFELDERAK
jgi:hypothetical protein